MLLKIFIIHCFFAISFAWQMPERCQPDKKSSNQNDTITTHVDTVIDIKQIAENQNKLLKQTYKEHEFLGVPIKATCFPFEEPVSMHAAYNCSFHTYNPRLLSSVACTNVACKLTHTVATTDTYSASEGYNWGVKITTKASLFDKIFEIGGEVSSGGTYTCTYTKGKTTTDAVECNESSGKSGNLQLYNVKTDMACDIGKITLEEELRDNRRYAVTRDGAFTQSEFDAISDSGAASFDPCPEIILDPSKISEPLLRKMIKEVPHFNIYTDMVAVHPPTITVYYFKKTTTVKEYTSVIPFTNEEGDSIFQYACMLTPFSN